MDSVAGCSLLSDPWIARAHLFDAIVVGAGHAGLAASVRLWGAAEDSTLVVDQIVARLERRSGEGASR